MRGSVEIGARYHRATICPAVCSYEKRARAPRRAGCGKLAGWYREFAERAGNPVIWEARLRTAEDLDAEADRLDRLPQD